jgi:hypothetical protein
MPTSDPEIAVVLAEERGGALPATWASHVVALERLAGLLGAHRRYRHLDLRAIAGGATVGRCRVVVDGADRRARIVELREGRAGVAGVLLAAAVRVLGAGGRADDVVSIVAEVRADAPRMQATLERLGFFPAAYYPGILASADGCADVVQYVRLLGVVFEESAALIDKLEWPAAQRVIDTVAWLAGRARARAVAPPPASGITPPGNDLRPLPRTGVAAVPEDDDHHPDQRDGDAGHVPPVRSLALHDGEPGESRRDVHGAVGRIRSPGRTRVERQEPGEDGQARRAGQQEPGRARSAQPEIGEVAAEDLRESGDEEETGDARKVTDHGSLRGVRRRPVPPPLTADRSPGSGRTSARTARW